MKVTTKLPEPEEDLIVIELSKRDAAILHRLCGNISMQHPDRERMDKLYYELIDAGISADEFGVPRLSTSPHFI